MTEEQTSCVMANQNGKMNPEENAAVGGREGDEESNRTRSHSVVWIVLGSSRWESHEHRKQFSHKVTPQIYIITLRVTTNQYRALTARKTSGESTGTSHKASRPDKKLERSLFLLSKVDVVHQAPYYFSSLCIKSTAMKVVRENRDLKIKAIKSSIWWVLIPEQEAWIKDMIAACTLTCLSWTTLAEWDLTCFRSELGSV